MASPAGSRSDPVPGSRLGVIVVVGTRPEAIKLVPIIVALRASTSFEPIVVSTGQHEQMVAQVLRAADIEPDLLLWPEGDSPRNLTELVATVMQRLTEAISESWGDIAQVEDRRGAALSGAVPAAVLVHGDTSSAMGAAIAAFHLLLPVVHVEAGLRAGTSNRTPFPEEMNRRLIASIASFHLAPTVENAENLIRGGVEAGQVFVTGNTGIDALQWAARQQVPLPNAELERFVAEADRLVVVTAHRRENWAHGLTGIATGIRRLVETRPDVRVVVPVHPNPIVRERLGAPLRGVDRVALCEPIPYGAFAHLLTRADMVITDSGGIQEEAPSLDVPVLVVRDQTERSEGLKAGTIEVIGTHPGSIVARATRLLDDPLAYVEMARAQNPYGDGRAAERIVAALEHLNDPTRPPPVPFGPGYDRNEVLEEAGYGRRLGVSRFRATLKHPPADDEVEARS